jgi:hypothetical protein
MNQQEDSGDVLIGKLKNQKPQMNQREDFSDDAAEEISESETAKLYLP